MRLNAFHGQVPVLEELGRLSRRLRDSVLGATPIALVEGRKRVLPACVSGVIEDRSVEVVTLASLAVWWRSKLTLRFSRSSRAGWAKTELSPLTACSWYGLPKGDSN